MPITNDDNNKRDSRAKHAERVTQQLTEAFRRVLWLYGEEAEPAITVPLARDILKDIELLDHRAVKYYLPRLMGIGIAEQADMSQQVDMIHSLVELLDVDFNDPSGNNASLKEARKDMFASYTLDQAKAICYWLEFITTTRHQAILDEPLSSAKRYWCGQWPKNG